MYIFYGCGGHCRSVVDVLLSNDPDAELVFIDGKAEPGEKLFGFPVIKNAGPENADGIFLTIGSNKARHDKFEIIDKNNLITIISKFSYVSRSAEIGKGCFVGNFAHIGPQVSIGANTIINTGSVVEHEVKIGSHCHIGPNSVISGRTVIGDMVFIGVGATVIDKIHICSDVMVGGGAAVVKDISEPGTYAGVPARKIR